MTREQVQTAIDIEQAILDELDLNKDAYPQTTWHVLWFATSLRRNTLSNVRSRIQDNERQLIDGLFETPESAA